MPRKKRINRQIESFSVKLTDWMGTPQSIIGHTLIFASAFISILLGASADSVMLIVTTIVSLEAIYLSLFIQMTVNRQAKSISAVEQNIDEIQEDVEALEDISEDLNELQEAEKAEELGTDRDFADTQKTLTTIQTHLIQLNQDLSLLKSEINQLKVHKPHPLIPNEPLPSNT